MMTAFFAKGPPFPRGQALVDPSSPRDGEKASYYSPVCLEAGEVGWMELEGNSNAETSAAFLRQLMERHVEPLNVIWDNAPAHRGEAVRAHLATPELCLRPVNPRFHEGRPCPAIARTSTLMKSFGAGCAQEVAVNLCLDTKAVMQDKVGDFSARLADLREEVKRRCRTVRQARAEELTGSAQTDFHRTANVYPTLVSV
jgi:hypothetical protein